MPTLPVRRVVLYKHGVGYFEREAAVTGNQTLTLTFKQAEVSDVLKSLTVLDLGGGLVSAVSYDATTPADKLLADIALTIPDTGSLVKLLPQLKGARVAVRPTGTQTDRTGVILGIDAAEVRTPSGIATQTRLSVLADGGEVWSFDLFDVAVQLLDDGLRRDLDFYLRTQLAAKKKDARAFTLFTEGEGERAVRVRYVLEAPVWKATYRILLGEPGADAPGSPEPLIQGWAVVDNTSDEDWEDVELALVAGLPVSFVHDLYTPRYVTRPVVEVKETAGVLPPMAEAGYEMGTVDFMKMDFAAGQAPPPPARVAAPGAFIGGVAELRKSAVSSVATQTRERQVGDLFEYAIDRPVTVRRNQSALVPIVLKPFAGRQVLLYQKQARTGNPLRCVEFENTTGLTLEGGPVTVLDAGSYAGEAMLDTMKPGEKRLVGYAVELSVRVTDSIDSTTRPVHRVVVQNGAVRLLSYREELTTYTFASVSDAEQLLYLDHPRGYGESELLDPPAPHETTDHYLRFRLTLPPRATTRFAVRRREPVAEQIGVAAVTEELLSAWVGGRVLDPRTRDGVARALAVYREWKGFDDRIGQLRRERDGIHEDQKRVRENLTALGGHAADRDLRDRYLRSLAAQEDRLPEIDRELREAERAKADAWKRVTQALADVEEPAGR